MRFSTRSANRITGAYSNLLSAEAKAWQASIIANGGSAKNLI